MTDIIKQRRNSLKMPVPLLESSTRLTSHLKFRLWFNLKQPIIARDCSMSSAASPLNQHFHTIRVHRLIEIRIRNAIAMVYLPVQVNCGHYNTKFMPSVDSKQSHADTVVLPSLARWPYRSRQMSPGACLSGKAWWAGIRQQNYHSHKVSTLLT